MVSKVKRLLDALHDSNVELLEDCIEGQLLII